VNALEKVKVEQAVGMVLAHDLTKIVPETFKGAAFKKGHIIQEEDIEELKNIGKYHVFVVPLDNENLHENESARRLADAVSSKGAFVTDPSEGRSNIKAAYPGILKVNKQALSELNQAGDFALVSLHNNTIVQQNQIIAAAKVIPLTIDRKEIEKAEQICGTFGPVIDVIPFFPLKTGIVVTGTEVYYGRIQDRFGEVLKEKVKNYGGEFLDLIYAPDDPEVIYRSIQTLIKKQAEAILVSGGMAVDADDVTPQAIERAATEKVTYGMPLLPGAMCMIAYSDDTPIVGIPACAMYHKTTVLDIVYPRLLAKERLKKEDLTSLAHGGLCLQCEICHFPICPFGK
jgi:molybdenum cofactor synthesis domain-containing protein